MAAVKIRSIITDETNSTTVMASFPNSKKIYIYNEKVSEASKQKIKELFYSNKTDLILTTMRKEGWLIGKKYDNIV